VNHLPAGQGWDGKSELSNVLAPWSGHVTEPGLPDVEDVQLVERHGDGVRNAGRGLDHEPEARISDAITVALH